MTIYEKACLKCDGTLELIRDMDDETVLKCINCAFTIDAMLATQLLGELQEEPAA